jgi:hypothetical protein
MDIQYLIWKNFDQYYKWTETDDGVCLVKRDTGYVLLYFGIMDGFLTFEFVAYYLFWIVNEYGPCKERKRAKPELE